MKQGLLFVLILLSANTCFSQISLLSSDLTSIDDQITRYGDTIPTYGPGGAGANQTWDFSAAVIEETLITDVVSTASTPYDATFSGSDYAMVGATASYLYFTHDASSMTTTGLAGDLLGTGEVIEILFSDPLILHQFPRGYGDFFDDTYAFEAEADGAAFSVYRVRLNHSGHVYDTTDAYGTLITPTGTYDALRVKSTDYTTDIIEVQLAQFFPWTQISNVTDTATSYTWHAQEEMLAIAEYTYDTLGVPNFLFSSVSPVSTVGVGDVDEEIPFALYPQPASDQLFVKGLSQSGNHQTQVFSIDGKMVRNEVLSGNSLNVTGLKSGMYILRITLADGTRPEPMKFIVQ
jgi:hypothetical protein